MINAAASRPHPPFLLPGVTGGLVPEVEQLRAAGQQAIQTLRGCEVVAVVGAGTATTRYGSKLPLPTAQFAPLAGEYSANALPLSLGVAVALAAGLELELYGIAPDATLATCFALGRELSDRPEEVGLLVMADGSARRGLKAPGYLDPRAAAFDNKVERALACGDPEPLVTMNADLANELLVAGRPAWQVLAGAFAGRRPTAGIVYSDDPFGVWYPVAIWATSDAH